MQTHQFETGKTSACDLARKLLAEGADRSDRLKMLRDGKPALTGSVGWFAARRVKETATFGPAFVKWRPFPDATFRPGMASSSPDEE